MSMQVGLKKQFVLIMLLIIISLTSFELFLHIISIWPDCHFIGKDAFFQHNIFEQYIICMDTKSLKYDTSYRYFYTVFPNQEYYTISINSFGLRTDEFNFEKTENQIRILMLGGSTIFGVGSSSDNHTIPGYLQEKINNYYPDSDILVINAGVPGSNTLTEYTLLKNNWLQLKPDIIINYDGWNDVTYRNMNAIKDIHFHEKNLENKNTGLTTFLVKTDFKLGILLIVNYKNFVNIFNNESKIYDNHPEFDHKNSEKFFTRNIKEICELSKTNNATNMIILQPILGTGKHKFSHDEKSIFLSLSDMRLNELKTLNNFSNYLDEIKNVCGNVYDFRNIFENYTEPIFYDEGHITDYGNEIVASEIFEKIEPIIKNELIR